MRRRLLVLGAILGLACRDGGDVDLDVRPDPVAATWVFERQLPGVPPHLHLEASYQLEIANRTDLGMTLVSLATRSGSTTYDHPFKGRRLPAGSTAVIPLRHPLPPEAAVLDVEARLLDDDGREHVRYGHARVVVPPPPPGFDT